jgi:hypothetical protein
VGDIIYQGSRFFLPAEDRETLEDAFSMKANHGISLLLRKQYAIVRKWALEFDFNLCGNESWAGSWRDMSGKSITIEPVLFQQLQVHYENVYGLRFDVDSVFNKVHRFLPRCPPLLITLPKCEIYFVFRFNTSHRIQNENNSCHLL